jgi:NADPH:quinone reductase-like Zn-dependent oxidoreductase
MHTTEAWVLHEGSPGAAEPAKLRKEAFAFADLAEDEALVETIYGSWEANMTHAIERRPIDVCRARGEARVVLGNAGVVRVLRAGQAVTHVEVGDLCVFFGTGRYDAFGYMELAHGYDAPGTVGLLAKQTKVAARNLFPLPPNTRHSPVQWAAFSLRYLTAWSNWRVAIGALRLQLSEADLPCPHVWGWGGGTTLAELDLARRFGCKATMVTASDAHRREIAAAGIETIDRREFQELQFDATRYERDPSYASAYRGAEKRFLAVVRDRTGGLGVSIFVDYIGTPVIRATLKALARQGVLATAGWKCGMDSPMVRAIECSKRHTHVHTHYARLSEAAAAIAYAEHHDWMPAVIDEMYAWDEIPLLAGDYMAGTTRSYFPVYSVNPL